MSNCTSPNQKVSRTTHFVLKSSAASLALSICTTSLAFSDLVHRVWGNKEVTSGKEKAFCWQEFPILLPSSAGMDCLWRERVSPSLGSWQLRLHEAYGHAIGIRVGNPKAPSNTGHLRPVT